MNPVGVYVPVSAIFKNTESNFQVFKDLLRNLSLTDTLFWCARLNLIVSNPLVAQRDKQQYALNIFFAPDQISSLNRFVQAHGGSNKVIVFFRGQLLELIRWACLFCEDKPNDGISFDDFEARQTFIRALLIAGDLWGKRIYGGRFSLEGGIEQARLRSLGAMRGAFTEISSGKDPLLALGRGKILFVEHFASAYPELEKEFTASTGLSLLDYYICLSAMTTHFVNRTPELASQGSDKAGLFNINTVCKDTTPEAERLLSKYISLEAQNPQELRAALWGGVDTERLGGTEPYNMKPLRQRPILRVADGRAIIIDPVFYAEKATVGPLFLLTAKAPAKANRIFGAFGEAVGSYTNEIFRRMYPASGGILVNRFTHNLKGRDGSGNEIEIADGFLNDVSEAAVFEIKAVWLRDNVILDDDYSLYLNNLREQYGTSGKDRAKGYAQLARAIKNIANGEWAVAECDLTRTKTIYPVLLVHDPLLDMPVMGNFLNSEFQTLLEPDEISADGAMRKGRFVIAPLIIMTLDELEALELSVRHFRLIDFLRDYTNACHDRIVSLHNFIGATEPYKNHMYKNPTLAKQSAHLATETLRRLFPSSEEQTIV